MASTSETGHAKNVANFEDLISFCTGYGTAYNPTKNSIKIAAMNTLLTSARNSLQTVKTTKIAYDNGTNAREIAFTNLKKLCTRVVNALDATDATKQTVDDAKTINRKIQGKRADNTKPQPVTPLADNTTPPSPEVHQISVSQQSYDNLVDNFGKLIVAVSAEPLYIPNETDLKATALNTLLTNLKTANTNVISVTPAYRSAIIARDALLYQPLTGLVETAQEVKKYVKSVFGAKSPQYKEISGLEFRKIKKL
ncbi:MAG: hypothetical protein KA968_11870 [Chitinophagaceae bacterium]|nr:hypothetical protein [Chitinophagaceae bacterium]MDD5571767.1 hypothetical protein [Bacteroidales bacterium]